MYFLYSVYLFIVLDYCLQRKLPFGDIKILLYSEIDSDDITWGNLSDLVQLRMVPQKAFFQLLSVNKTFAPTHH